jgi:hypothetical protein
MAPMGIFFGNTILILMLCGILGRPFREALRDHDSSVWHRLAPRRVWGMDYSNVWPTVWYLFTHGSGGNRRLGRAMWAARVSVVLFWSLFGVNLLCLACGVYGGSGDVY